MRLFGNGFDLDTAIKVSSKSNELALNKTEYTLETVMKRLDRTADTEEYAKLFEVAVKLEARANALRIKF